MLLFFELDYLDRTVIGRFLDTVRVLFKVCSVDNRRGVVAHAEDIGTKVFAYTAEGAFFVDPNFFY